MGVRRRQERRREGQHLLNRVRRDSAPCSQRVDSERQHTFPEHRDPHRGIRSPVDVTPPADRLNHFGIVDRTPNALKSFLALSLNEQLNYYQSIYPSDDQALRRANDGHTEKTKLARRSLRHTPLL